MLLEISGPKSTASVLSAVEGNEASFNPLIFPSCLSPLYLVEDWDGPSCQCCYCMTRHAALTNSDMWLPDLYHQAGVWWWWWWRQQLLGRAGRRVAAVWARCSPRQHPAISTLYLHYIYTIHWSPYLHTGWHGARTRGSDHHCWGHWAERGHGDSKWGPDNTAQSVHNVSIHGGTTTTNTSNQCSGCSWWQCPHSVVHSPVSIVKCKRCSIANIHSVTHRLHVWCQQQSVGGSDMSIPETSRSHISTSTTNNQQSTIQRCLGSCGKV